MPHLEVGIIQQWLRGFRIYSIVLASCLVLMFPFWILAFILMMFDLAPDTRGFEYCVALCSFGERAKSAECSVVLVRAAFEANEPSVSGAVARGPRTIVIGISGLGSATTPEIRGR